MTDLHTVKDHPAALIAGLIGSGSYEFSASYLRQYEGANGVTFAALDNDALKALREVQRKSVESFGLTYDFDKAVALIDEFRDAVTALLGEAD